MVNTPYEVVYLGMRDERAGYTFRIEGGDPVGF
jgi:hypothetical protein